MFAGNTQIRKSENVLPAVFNNLRGYFSYLFYKKNTMQKIFHILIFALFALLSSYSQIPNGTWRDHLPYSHAKKIVEMDGKIFCATDGGMFSYNLNDNSIQKYSKVNGLSDIEISTMGYGEEANTLLVAYMNGNLDLIRNDTIYNLPDIKLKSIAGEKAVNNVFFSHGYAYLACNFGVVLVDINRCVIKDTYIFGPEGSSIIVNDITSDGTNLYAATVEGIYEANLSNSNLVDFNAWTRMNSLPEAGAEYKNIVFFNGKLFTYYKNPITNLDDIITFDEGVWKKWEHGYSDNFLFITRHNNYLVFASMYRADIYDQNENLVNAFGVYYCKDVMIDHKNQIWYADIDKGLGKVEATGISYIFPNGPSYRDVGDMALESGKLWVGGGTEASHWAGHGAYVFSDEKWNSFNGTNTEGLKNFYNINRIAIDPLDTGHVYGGSNGYGIVEFQNGEVVGTYDETTSILETVPGYGHGYIYTRGVNFDRSGNLWISTTLSNHPVYVRHRDKSWEKLTFDYTGFGLGTRVGEILPTSLDQEWLLIELYGVLVFTFDEDNGITKERAFTIRNQEGDLLDKVFSIAEDREGNIWIGTNKGPVIYYNPSDIFTDDALIGYQVKIPRRDSSNLADILLATEKITAIAVDGGNRKWLGTENSGVFLVSDDGKEEINHFTVSNSPLPSNTITSIAINHANGEVFFGTDKGIFSYRGQSTEGSDDFSNAYVFPNPVRENYQGDITITGLVEDVNVKITDVSGNLVYETKALGGQAIWDGNNFKGKRVGTGVYLVFCSNEDGSKTFVTKLLFIH
jgi:hypothetical protein